MALFRFRDARGLETLAQLARGQALPAGRDAILRARYHPAHLDNASGAVEVDAATTVTPGDGAEVLAPVPAREVPCVWAVGLNYRKHAEETGMDAPRFPTLFMKAATAITGPYDPIVTPKVCKDELDFEGEVAIVIGKQGKDIPAERAMDHVLGLCVAKGQDVRIATTVTRPDGAEHAVQDARTSDMIFTLREIVAFVSQDTTLLPWTVIVTGTPEGVGFTRRPPLFLQPGDSVEVGIEGLGSIVNPVQ